MRLLAARAAGESLLAGLALAALFLALFALVLFGSGLRARRERALAAALMRHGMQARLNRPSAAAALGLRELEELNLWPDALGGRRRLVASGIVEERPMLFVEYACRRFIAPIVTFEMRTVVAVRCPAEWPATSLCRRDALDLAESITLTGAHQAELDATWKLRSESPAIGASFSSEQIRAQHRHPQARDIACWIIQDGWCRLILRRCARPRELPQLLSLPVQVCRSIAAEVAARDRLETRA